MIRYDRVLFDDGFRFMIAQDGAKVPFTRSETKLLQFLSGRPGRIATRGQLLDALTEVGSDKSDRNVDFLVNRLRRKLGDNARDPRFVATRYGEGYVWLPEQARDAQKAADAYVVVGPIRGFRHLGEFEPIAQRFVSQFHRSIEGNFGADKKIVLDPDCPPRAAFSGGMPEIAVDLTFVVDRRGLECVVQASAFRSGAIYAINRHVITTDPLGSDSNDADKLASRIATEIWKSLTLKADRMKPLPVAMQDASLSLAGGIHGWAESHRRLKELSAQNPTDHGIKMMIASNLHTKYVQHGLELFASDVDTRAEDEAEIEALVTASLPFVQHDPFFAATAAKLLFFVDRGYHGIAMEMIEDVNRHSTAVAATLTILGLLRNFVGETDRSLTALNQALDLAERGSEFEVYIMCVKCQVLMAVDDRKALDALLAELYQRKPALKFLYDIFYGSVENPSKEALGAMHMMTPKQATGMLTFVDYMCARFFHQDIHRQNTLRVPTQLLTMKFGPGIIPSNLSAESV